MLFNLGTVNIFSLSHQFKNLDLKNKTIYLSPSSQMMRELYNTLKNYNPKELKFIDDYKKGENIITPSEVKKHDYIFLYSPHYFKQIIKSLPKSNLFILSYKKTTGYIPFKYNKINKFLIDSFYLFEKCKLHLPYFHRSFLFYYLNIPVHKNERNLLKLKNKHLNKRAFIVGNGPSLKMDDLDMLKNEITFAANKIFLAYSDTQWRPTYYSVEDDLDIAEYYNTVKEMRGSIKLLPFTHIKNHPIIDDAIYYPLVSEKKIIYKCSNNIKKIYTGGSVVYTMLQLALVMGIKEIYLIGVDFSYTIPKRSENSEIIYHQNENNHFHKDYRSHGDKWSYPNYEVQKKAYSIAKDFAEKNNIKIFNASRETKLEVFKRIDLDSLF